MFTVVLNGSPRREGHTMALVRAMLSVVGGEQAIVDAYVANIAACVHCSHCAANPACRVSDGMGGVRRHIEAADAIVIASPLHFGSLTGPLVSLCSRFQVYWNAEKRRDNPLAPRVKRAGLILTGGSDYPGMFQPARQAAGLVLGRLNAKLSGEVAAPGTDRLPAGRNRSALAAAAELGAKLSAPRSPPG